MWSKGIFISNTLYKFQPSTTISSKTLPILTLNLTKLMLMRVENKTLKWTRINKYILNVILSNYTSINADFKLLYTNILLRLILIKSFKGKSLLMSKPMNGQRTWSNANSIKNTSKHYLKMMRLNSWL